MFAKRKAKKANKVAKFVGRTVGVLAGVYAGLFCVFYFDLDGKLLYYVVEPFMKNHFDNMERRDPHTVPYEQIDTDYMKIK
jgi:hypothetical protein